MENKKVFGDNFWGRVDERIHSSGNIKNLKMLAQKADLNIQTIYNQRTRRQLPSDYNLTRICEVLQTSPSELLFNRKEIQPLTHEQVLAGIDSDKRLLEVCSLLMQREDKLKAIHTLLDLD